MNKKVSKLSRRSFMKAAGGVAAFTIVPRHVLGGAGNVAPSEKLNVAGVGIGGMGKNNIERCAGENIVALCDVDWSYSAPVFAKYPKAKTYKDYRKMLEQKDIDAVVIGTPDHMHTIIALAAMELGKHVYVQKPLAPSVGESRKLLAAARKYKVATQMGNQGHSGDGVRMLCEWIWDGAIGPVREVHSWTNRPVWPQGLMRPTEKMQVPKDLDWDKFIGVAPMRPYHDAYHPARWRGWLDFGAGSLGDMGCHLLDSVFWALKLGSGLESINASGSKYVTRSEESKYGKTWVNNESFPRASIVRYKFGARGDMAPVKVTWYDGGLMPEVPEEFEDGRKLSGSTSSTIFVGDKGKIICGEYGQSPRIIPETKMRAYKRPAPYLARVVGGNAGHEQNWIDACKGGEPASSNFEYSCALNEFVVLGNLAVQNPGKVLKWDAEKMRVTNCDEANKLVDRVYRTGW
jgi:predicted dehydrogenase